MRKYGDLECSILSCLLIKPKLMEEVILEDKHFVNYQRIWQFMKRFYKKFGNFDFNLMASVCTDQYKLMMYIVNISNCEPTYLNFNKYQKQLIDLYNEEEKDKWIIKKVYEEVCDLWVRNITTKEFKTRIEEIYKNVEEIFKEGKDKND